MSQLINFQGDHLFSNINTTGTVDVDANGYLQLSVPANTFVTARRKSGTFDTRTFFLNISERYMLSVNIDAPENINGITVYFSLKADNTQYGYFKIPMGSFIKGRNEFLLGWKDFVFSAGATKANFTNMPIVSYQVRVDANALGTANVQFFSFDAIDASQGKILIWADNGWNDQYTVIYPKLRRYGYKFTLAVTPSRVGKTDYCTWSQLKEMHGNGVAMVNHTYNHINLKTLSYQDQLKELNNCKLALENQGIGGSADIVAYANGGYNQDTQNIITNYFAMGRTVIEGLQSKTGDKTQLKIINLLPSVTLDKAKQLAYDCHNYGGLLIFLLHRIDNTEPSSIYWSRDKFVGLIDYLHAIRARVVTANDLRSYF